MLDMMSVLLLCFDCMFSFYVYSLVLLVFVDNFVLTLSFSIFFVLYIHISISYFLMLSHLFAVDNWVSYIDVLFFFCVMCYLEKAKCWTPIKHVQRYSKAHRLLPLDNFLYMSGSVFGCALIYFLFLL